MQTKKRYYLVLYFLFFLINCNGFEKSLEEKCSDTIEVFGKYNFSDYNYNLYVIKNTENIRVSKTIGAIWFSNKNFALKNIQASWILCKDSVIHRCGYDYLIWLYRNDVLVEKMKFNSKCNDLVAQKGRYSFDFRKYIVPYVFSSKPVFRYNLKFNNKNDRLFFISNINKDFIVLKDFYSSNGKSIFYKNIYQFSYTEPLTEKTRNYKLEVENIIKNEIDINDYYLEINNSFLKKSKDSIFLTFNLYTNKTFVHSMDNKLLKPLKKFEPIYLKFFSLENIYVAVE